MAACRLVRRPEVGCPRDPSSVLPPLMCPCSPPRPVRATDPRRASAAQAQDLADLASFWPQEGGSIITIIGSEFSAETDIERQRSVLLSHAGAGGVERECCATTTVSDTVMTCRLPRVTCLLSNPTNPCPEPGARGELR